MEKIPHNYLPNLLHLNLETGDFPGPFITISRQAGCSAQRIAIKLSKILTGYSYMADTKTDAEWKWVDKNVFAGIVREMVSEIEHGNYDDAEDAKKVLNQVAKAFSDESIYDITDKKHIDALKSVICRLASQGRMIIVGRSAGIILKAVPNKVSVRLEAPVDWRINRIMQVKDFSKVEAREYITKMDNKRDTFIEKVIGRPAENNDFDVIFNYASLQDDLIVDAILNILRNKKIVSMFDEY
jgi:cytidylate kinase